MNIKKTKEFNYKCKFSRGSLEVQKLYNSKTNKRTECLLDLHCLLLAFFFPSNSNLTILKAIYVCILVHTCCHETDPSILLLLVHPGLTIKPINILNTILHEPKSHKSILLIHNFSLVSIW